MRRQFIIRTYIVAGFLVLVALVFIFRLYMLQVVYGDKYSDLAEGQYVTPAAEPLYDRGDIYFTDKDGRNVAAATVASGYIVAMVPAKIKDAELVYEKISEIIPVNRETFFTRASRVKDPYEEIAKRVGAEEAQSVDDLQLAGVNLYKERWRRYPGGTLAAHTIGFIGSTGEEVQGLYGLERYYDDTLSRGSRQAYINFFAEIFANIKTVFSSKEHFSGDIITSIEPSVQVFLEEELEAIHEKHASEISGAIIIHPGTGEIYALAVYPSFDPNDRSDVESISRFSNPLIEYVYEMGSIIKPLTVAAGLDAGVITAKTTYYDAGTLTLDGEKISNFDGRGRGTVNMQEVLSQSLNTGAAFIADSLGNERMREYFYNYGLPHETGIDLPSEGAGLVANLDSPRKIEFATASFGQGIATTPIATVRALSVLGNGGTLPFPHIAKAIRYRSGIVKEISYPEGERVISKEASEEITRMLVEVVDSALANGKVKNERYSIAAKTGTAQIANPNGGGYYEDRHLHSFFGYLPAYNPKFLIFYFTVYPKGVRYASETLTTPFINTTKFLINYYNIPPDR